MVTPGAATSAPAAPRRPTATDFAALREQIGEIRTVNGNDYHDGAQVIRALNRVLLEGNWSQRILDHGYDEREAWALVELAAILWTEDEDGGLSPSTVVFQEIGCHKIKQSRNGSGPVNVGHDRKAAVTDGLKRCARLLGIGLYLWDKEDLWELPEAYDPAAEEAQRERQLQGRQNGQQAPRERPVAINRPQEEPRRPQAQQEPVEPLSKSERAALENRYEALREQAHEAGFHASWSNQPASNWTDAQLPKYTALFEGHLQRSRQPRGAA